MTDQHITFTGGRIFDGAQLHDQMAARFKGGVLVGILPAGDIAPTDTVIDLAGDILAPGFVDLQVNGGGGVMFNDDPSVATLGRIATAHRTLGTVALLPTLITDTPKTTTAAIEAAVNAVEQAVPGIVGLHLEGPHLSVARKGAHDAALIRKMRDADLQELLNAKTRLPVLKVTVAPESVSTDQVAALAQAGIVVSLGHTDADYETCRAYVTAGARCVTHLFNAMSPLGSRAPGLVGAALSLGELSAGLIADGIHVSPASMAVAWAAKAGPGRLFLVSDAMAVAGSRETSFALQDRRITRRAGRLELDDGTLAGADLDLITALRVLCKDVAVGLEDALQAATTVPARLIGISGEIKPGQTEMSEMNRISASLDSIAPLAASIPGRS